jgi:hypothetical protein
VSVPRLQPLAAAVAALLVLLAMPVAAGAAGSVRVIAVPLKAAAAPAARVNATTNARRTTLKPLRVKGGFSLAGVHWRGTRRARLELRTRTLHGRYGPWQAVSLADLANAGERRRNAPWMSEPAWFGRSAWLQIRVRGRVRDLRAVVVKPGPDPTLRVAPRVSPRQPSILPRSAWGADEKVRKGRPVIAPRIRAVVVHHTATPNGYAADQVASVIRSLYLYQVRGNGLSDLGYNYLVDAQGRIYEGRYGGIDRNVVGSHTAGFNAGTVGVALIGNFTTATPPAKELRALEGLLAWRLDLAHVDPRARVTLTSEGNDRYAKGRAVQFSAIFAHRDAGPADCPGDGVMAKMGAIRAATAGIGDLKVFDPTVTPPTIASGAFRPIRFHARLSRSSAWRVTVVTTGGATVARFDGSGAVVDATWDGSVLGGGGLPRADLLRWRIEAGSARPAAGAFDGSVGSGGVAGGPSVTGSVDAVSAAPVALGAGASGRLIWRQRKAGTVRVSVTTPAGDEVAVLRAAAPITTGSKQLVWNGRRLPGTALLPSGHYRYVIRTQATGSATVETATANVDIRRQAFGFVATGAFSPNGDGFRDVAGFSFQRNEPGDAQLRLFHGTKLVKNVALLYDQAPGPFQYRWTGGGVRDGSYTVQLLVPGNGGSLAFSAPVRIDTHGPTFRVSRVRKINRRRDVIVTMRLNEGGVVQVRRGSKVLLTRTLRAGTRSVRLNRKLLGTARSVRLVGRDALGNVTAKPRKVTIPR